MSTYDPPNEIPLPPIFNPINFVSDNGMGISQTTADLRYLKKGGDTATGVINFTSGILTNDGAPGSNPMGFISQSNTGIYRIGASNLGLSCGGVKQLDLSSTLATFTNIIRGPDGAFNAPTYSFTSSTGTGMYYPGANRIGLVCSTSPVMTLSASTVLCNQVLAIQNGSITNCGLQFASSANTGLIYVATNKMNAVANGTSVCTFSNLNVPFYVPVLCANGSVSAVSLGNSTYTTTGFYWEAGPILDVSVNGTRRAFWNTTGYAIGDLGDAVARKNFGSYTFTAPNLSQHGTATTTITFANAFASAPRVHLTTQFVSGSSSYMYGVLASVADVSTTGFTIYICNLVNNSTVNDIKVNWIAEL